MGGFDEQPKVGGRTHVMGDAIGTPGAPGKATLVDDPAADARNDPKVRPPQYAAMDADCVRLLDQGKQAGSLKAFKDKPAPFWDLVDQNLDAAQLQSLTQTVIGARNAGLLPQISNLVDVYNCNSSWGIHFESKASAPGGWGKDYDPLNPSDPQARVRNEHDSPPKKHVWYRQPSGPGNPGMHIGTQEEGEPHTNLHWDPSNPMDHVSDGPNPMLAMMPSPLTNVPKGCAVYNVKALLTHADDIGWIDKNAKFLKRFVPAHSPNAGPNASTEPFFMISNAAARGGWGKKFADWELGRKHEMIDDKRGVDTATKLANASNALIAHDVAARPLAVDERTAGNDAARIALAKTLETLLESFYNATTAFFKHLHAEMGENPSSWEKDDLIKMGDNYWSLQGTIFDIHKRRAEKKKAAP